MAEEIAFENGQISNFQGLVTLTLDRVMLHKVVHHSSTYMLNFIEIEQTFCGRTDAPTYVTHVHMYVHTYVQMIIGHLRLALLGRVCPKSRG